MDRIFKKTAYHLAMHITTHLRMNNNKRLAAHLQYEVGIEEMIFEGLKELGIGGKKDDDIQQG
jgi:hypothetical protein